MADRSVLVRLRADISDFTRKFASAAAATSTLGASARKADTDFDLLDKKTKSYTLEMAKAEERSTRFRKALREQARAAIDAEQGIIRTTDAARDSDKEIDRLSGRLAVFRDAALTIGPAIVPLGAAAIPALTGSVVALGSAAAGLGVSILALQGVGDALGALDDYQLEKTPENLAKLAAEMEKMGPSGAHFVRFLDSLEPELKSLQMAARDGLLPGVEDGIDSLLTDLPQIRDLVTQLAGAMGELASDAGADLAGPEWESFFEYLRTDAAPALEEFGRTVGNFAQGFADMLVAFAPASRDFSGGMLEMSRRFAEWSAGLENNDSFQSFVDYIRQSGPQAVELLGSVVKALASIVEAMAPYGSVVLPVLTQFANLISAIASTDAGSVFFAAAAGLVAFNRAASMTGPAMTKMSAALAANPWGLAAAALTVAVVDVVTADDQLVAATKRAQDALNSADTSAMRDELTALQEEIDNTALSLSPESGMSGGLPFVGMIKPSLEEVGNLWTKFGGAQEKAKQTEEELQNAIANGRPGLLGARDAIVRYAGGALQAAAALEEETAALRDSIDAMREKRMEALRGLNAELNYQQAIDDARRSLKENGKTVDETTEKGRNNLRTLYALAAGWNEQSDAAKSASGSMAAAKRNFIDTAVAMDMPIAKARRLANELFEIPASRSTKIMMETDAAMARLIALKNRYDAIRDKSVTISVNTGGGTGGGSPMGVVLGGSADGMTVPGRRNPYGDKGLYMLAPGEEVISNRRGQADRHRALLKKINAGLADGGTSGGWAPMGWAQQSSGTNMGINGLSPALNGFQELKDALKQFKKQLEEATKAVDRERRQRDDLIAASKAFQSAVGGAYAKADPFSGGLADFDLGTAANTNDSNAAKAALAAAANAGLDGPLYQALAASGNLSLLQEFAGLSSAQIAEKEKQFASQSQAQTGLGSAAAEHAFAEAIKDQTKELKEAQKERKKYADLTKEVQRRLDALPDRVEKGARAGVGDRDRRTSQRVAAGR